MRSHVAENVSQSATANRDSNWGRPTVPIRQLSTFLDFLAELEEIFGPIAKERRIGGGDRFLL